ncbi:MAG: hypothetical protein PWP45_875 [Tepidanaerobacteraceae bacterium]|nr:hypothetical protein [Tepidanaerobacteraceae bacterium]
MPEISGPGQKKLLESKGIVVAGSAEDILPLVFYLAASGIGQLYVILKKKEDFSDLKSSLQDLNPDFKIEFFNDIPNLPNQEKIDFAVFADEYEESGHYKGVPKVLTLIRPWDGYIRTIMSTERTKVAFSQKKDGPSDNSPGLVFSRFFAGTLSAIEAIKICLNLGKVLENPLYYNLLDMEFKFGKDSEVVEDIAIQDPLKDKDLSALKVLIVGSGGLGSPAALSLALAGVKNIGLVDGDTVEISNLNRQILHSTSRIGMPKVESAETFLKKINSGIDIVKYHMRFSKDNALEIIKDYDIIVDGVDNLPTRYLLNDACVLAGKPLAEAAVLRFEGIAMTILPGKSPCYRCVFPKMPQAAAAPSCAEAGVLGPVPGVMGTLEAAEALKIFGGCGKLLSGRLLIFDSLEFNFMTPVLSKNEKCPACGENPSIKDLSGNYDFVCENT